MSNSGEDIGKKRGRVPKSQNYSGADLFFTL